MSVEKKPTRSLPESEVNPSFRILVVEDDDVLRRLNAEVLMDSGYQVDAAQDGAAAWAALQLFDYDLLITDFDVPNLSGIDLLKKLHGARMALPVIMVSGTMPAAELNRQPWLQVDAALLKPHTHAELLATVSSVLHAPVALADRQSWPSFDHLQL